MGEGAERVYSRPMEDAPAVAAWVDEAGQDLLDDDGVAGDAGLIEDELLVEEISIDGMCGVY